MVLEQAKENRSYSVPVQELHRIAPDVLWQNAPTISANLLPTTFCQLITDWYVACSSEARRRDAGQFFTPSIVAQYMAKATGALPAMLNMLDPGVGTGMLSCAVCEMAPQQHISAISITAYEKDPVLHRLCMFILSYTRDWLQDYGITLSFTVWQCDFIEALARQNTPLSLWGEEAQIANNFDLVILNPPYAKMNQQDARVRMLKESVEGRTNLYTVFMSLAASALQDGGCFVSITPRSFASGAYFRRFRQHFFDVITPEFVHNFDSRRSTFEDADVLQENIILVGHKRKDGVPTPSLVTIACSSGIDALDSSYIQQVEYNLIVAQEQNDAFLHLPVSDIDVQLLQVFKCWQNTLDSYTLAISTGPVVPFRAADLLVEIEQVQAGNAVPLLWLQHVQRMRITWPVEGLKKAQGVLLQKSSKLLVRNTTQIILRRFSAKEEARRITAAVLAENTFGTEYIGLENHLNYLYRRHGEFTYNEAVGLAAFLNSSLIDRYFRITNGNTQINATELRKLPLPDWQSIVRIGEQVVYKQIEQDALAIEHVVMDELREELIVGDEEEEVQIPVMVDSRMFMGKLQEAQHILRELGLPPAQQNEISALTLLALGNLDEPTPWSGIKQELITIHNMMSFMKVHYGRIYAENTREVVRRQVIHQFEQARLIDRNPDDGNRPTNSPNTCYGLTDEAREMLSRYGSPDWEQAIIQFSAQYGALQAKYQRLRESVALPLQLTDGTQLYLSLGKHNKLQIAVVEIFGPRFVPGATILYLGDAAKKHIVYEENTLERLGVPITQHDKLPDVIFFDEARNRLYLIEAVTSHGPVSHKRLLELEQLLEYCTAQRVYISTFLTYNDYRKYIKQVAWNSDIWIAEIPEHMLHHNGDKFMSLHG